MRIFVILVLLSGVSSQQLDWSSICAADPSNTCCNPANRPLLNLALEWTPSVQRFTMHGLWPDGHRTKPTDEQHSMHMSVSALRDLLDANVELGQQMQTHWPSNHLPNTVFWSHEWNKHGVTAEHLAPHCFDDDSHRSMYEYFQTALQLRDMHDPQVWFERADITPSEQPRSLSEFLSAAKAAGLEAQFICRGNHLSEVRIELRVINHEQYVPTSSNKPHHCPQEGIIYV